MSSHFLITEFILYLQMLTINFIIGEKCKEMKDSPLLIPLIYLRKFRLMTTELAIKRKPRLTFLPLGGGDLYLKNTQKLVSQLPLNSLF